MADGIGLPTDFNIIADAGIGLNLAQGLVEPADGVLSLDQGRPGTKRTLTFGLKAK